MATKWISPTWRMPEESNQSKFENYSLDFPSSDLITIPSILQNASTATFNIWINFNDASTSAIFGKGTSTDFFSFYTWSNGWLYFWMKDGGVAGEGRVTPFKNATPLVNAGEWNMLTVVFDGTETGNDRLKIYLNGGSSNIITNYSGTIPATLANTSNDFLIGSAPNATSISNSKLSQVSIFNYALSTDQRNYLYNSGTPVNPMAISGNAPIAYYPLGGSSTGDAAVVSPSTLTVPNESVPSATVFYFNNSNINVGDIDNAGALSFSTWLSTTSTNASSYQNIAWKRNGSTGWFMQYLYGSGTNGKIKFYIFHTNGSGTGSEVTITNLQSGDWFNIALTYDGTDAVGALKLYSNGTEVYSNSSTLGGTGIAVNNDDLYFGGSASSAFFTCKLSNIQLWDTGLSAPNVTTLYNNGVPYTGTQPQAANLKAWYKLNVDTSTWNGTDWLLSNSGITPTYTTAVELPKSFQNPPGAWPGLTRSDTSWSGTDITLSFWVRYPNGHDGDINYIRASGISIGSIGSTNLQFGSGTYRNFPIGNLQNKAWHNVVVYIPNSSPTFLISDVRCFIDGSEVAGTNIGSGTASQITTISGWGANSGVGTSNLSNWTLFNSDLTGSISTLYNGGTPADVSSLNPVSWYKCDSTNVTFPSPGGSSMTFTDSSSNSNNATGAYDSDGIGGPFPSMTTTNVQAGDGVSDGMTTANLVNSDLTRSIPYSSYSMAFDGIDDFISIYDGAAGSGPSSLKFTSTDSFSISCWINMVSSSGQENIISFRGTPLIWLYRSGTTIGFRLRGDSSGTESVITTTTTNEAWHNIVAIRDYNSGSPQLKLYIDNVAVTPVTDSTSGDFDSYDKFSICNDNYSGGRYWFDGNTSNVAIFNSALTEDQILTIYNGGVPNDISSLSPVSWWSLAGDSYYDGTNWICPDLSTNSNNGTSSGMGGTELVGNGPGSTANGIATSMNIPENLKGNAPNSSKNAFSVNMNPADRVEDVAPTP